MNKTTILVVTASMIITMVGCTKTEPVQTVEWYKTHEKERKETLKKCEDDPGQLEATPNCINASKAKQKLIWGSRKGITPPKAEDVLK